METHQALGLLVAQVFVVPAAYAAAALGGTMLHAWVEHRASAPGFGITAWMEPKARFAIMWGVINAIFLSIAGII